MISDDDLRRGDWRWLLFVPLAAPSVAFLDIAMVFISILPLIMRGDAPFPAVSAELGLGLCSRLA